MKRLRWYSVSVLILTMPLTLVIACGDDSVPSENGSGNGSEIYQAKYSQEQYPKATTVDSDMAKRLADEGKIIVQENDGNILKNMKNHLMMKTERQQVK